MDETFTIAAIQAVHQATGRIIDPHTAVGMAAARELGKVSGPVVVLSTAHPAKFPDAVTRATGSPPPVPARLQGLEKKPERVEILANSLPLIREFISSRLGS